jgi:hypothetical protein
MAGRVGAVLVLVVWVGAVLLAGVLLGVLWFELSGHVRRLGGSLAEAERALAPQIDRLTGSLAVGNQRGRPPHATS